MCILSPAMAILGQVPDTLWTKKYEGSGFTKVQAIYPMSDGGYLLGGEGLYVLRTDDNGEIIWNTRLTGYSFTVTSIISEASSGEFIVIGLDWLGLFTETGDTTWTINGTHLSDNLINLFNVIPTLDHNYMAVGKVAVSPTDEDLYLLKFTPAGDTLWTRQYGGDQIEHGRTILQNPDSSFTVIGTHYTSTYFSQLSLLNFDVSGNIRWSRLYGGSWTEDGYDILQIEDGGYIILGSTGSYGAGARDIWVLRTDSTGETLWTETYGEAGMDMAYDMVQTPDGGYILAGESRRAEDDYGDGYLLKINATGAVEWTQQYGGAYEDIFYTVTATPDSGYAVGGVTERWTPNNPAGVAWLVRLAPEPYTAIGSDIPELPTQTTLGPNYPNPFNAQTRIPITLSQSAFVELAIYNLRGTRIDVVLNQYLGPGEYVFSWPGKPQEYPHPSGIYLARLQINGRAHFQRMVLLR